MLRNYGSCNVKTSGRPQLVVTCDYTKFCKQVEGGISLVLLGFSKALLPDSLSSSPFLVINASTLGLGLCQGNSQPLCLSRDTLASLLFIYLLVVLQPFITTCFLCVVQTHVLI